MSQVLRLIFCFLVLSSFQFSNLESNEKTISDFSLRNTDGKMVALSDYKDAKGFIIIFTCNHCPFANLYYKRLNELNKKYAKQHIPVLAINPMDTLLYDDEEFKYMQSKAKKNKFSFPYLQDARQAIAKDFGATHTPQVFLIWKEKNLWKIKYNGAIDDNGEHPEKATSFISKAIEELLSGKEVSQPEMNAIGCKIMYRK
jgi:peroxiredoxin